MQLVPSKRWLLSLVLLASLLSWRGAKADAAPMAGGSFYLQPGDTVLFFGDSITDETKYEWMLFNEIGTQYPLLVQKDGRMPDYSKPVFEGGQVKFVCAGFSGFTAGQALPNLAGLIDKYHPTVAVVCFGMNDRYKDRNGYIKNMTTIIEQLKAAKAEVTVLSAPTVCPLHNPSLQPFIKTLGDMKDEAQKLASDEKVGFVDWYTPTLKFITETGKDSTWGDGIHPNLDGDKFAVDGLLQAWSAGAPLGKAGDPRPAVKSSPVSVNPPAPASPPASTNAPSAAIQPAFSQRIGAEPSTDATQPAAATSGWVDVTNNVGGDTWGYAGVTYVATVPGKDAVIAGVSEKGLWLSNDRGATWSHLGDGDAEQIKNRPAMILFDPKNPDIFWEAGSYAAGPFKTTDGGKTFQRLGKLDHTDSIAVDFADPQRQTILVGKHETIRSLQKSTDGGATFENIGANMPEDSNFDNEVILIDKNTYITNAAGWWPNTSNKKFAWGIFRTEDGGKTWTCLNSMGPDGPPLLASDGSIYWSLTWGGGIIRSTDKGKTWEKLASPLKNCPVELPGGKLVGLADQQLYISSDTGKTWTKFLDPLPWKGWNSGLAYSEKGNCLYAWTLSDKKRSQAIMRCDLPN